MLSKLTSIGMCQPFMLPQIPPELHDRIIDHLHDDDFALAACGLANRIWLPSVRYHRFGSTRISVPKVAQFSDLLENSPEIGTYVHDLTLGTRRTPVHRVLPDHMITALVLRLPYVEHLRLVSFVWKPRYQVFNEAYPGLRTLRIEHCRFEANMEELDGFVDFVSSFDRLTTLSIRCPFQMTHADGRGWPWHKALRHPPLRVLDWASVPGAETLCDWLKPEDGPSLPNISTFFISVSEEWEGTIAMHAFRSFGETIRTLSLVLDSYSGLECKANLNLVCALTDRRPPFSPIRGFWSYGRRLHKFALAETRVAHSRHVRAH